MPVSPARKRWLDSRRAQLNSDSRQRREEARANGLCIQCLNEEASPDHATCEGCRKANRKRMQRTRDGLRKAGICLRCRNRRASAAGFRNRKRLCKLRKRKPAWCSTCRQNHRSEHHRLVILEQLVHGPFTVIQLARAFRLAQRTILKRIKPLVADGVIERWKREDDAGYTWLRLTQKGWRELGAKR